MRVKFVNNEVSVADERIVRVGREDVDALKASARSTARFRSRLCAHKQSSDRLHEMIIVLGRPSYIRPHKHQAKSESFHVIEGELDVVIFDETGLVTDVVEMGDYRSGRNFFYRLEDPLFHTLIIRTPEVVFHETTNGPFRREDTIFAPWSPEENDVVEVERFMKVTASAVGQFVGCSNAQAS